MDAERDSRDKNVAKSLHIMKHVFRYTSSLQKGCRVSMSRSMLAAPKIESCGKLVTEIDSSVVNWGPFLSVFTRAGLLVEACRATWVVILSEASVSFQKLR